MKKINANLLNLMFKQGVFELNRNKGKIDALNVFPVPDGDTGTNMSMTVNYALDEINKLSDYNIASLTKVISKGCLMGARGNSGVILSQIFRGFAEYAKNVDEFSTKTFANALKEAEKFAYKAVLKPVEGTILTVIKDIANEAVLVSDTTEDFNDFFNKILLAGEKSLKNTQNILPILKEAGVVDSGATGLVCIFKGFQNAILGKIDNSYEETSNTIEIFSENELKHKQADISVENLKYMYCTEFILKIFEGRDVDMRNQFLELGDSMVYVPDDDIIKIHIHTDRPDKIFNIALENGEFIRCKVENMKEQHSEIVDEVTGTDSDLPKFSGELKKYGFISVASGEGISEIFKNLGVDYIILGGQTMNPSIEDITKAIDSINAENIYILPNNSNIIMAANQSKEISDKNVFVIPTKTVTQGFSSMIAFDSEKNTDENFENMVEAIKNVKSIQITNAVRDTIVNDIEIKEGEFLAILDSNIVASEKDIKESIKKSLELAIDEDSSIISLYYGIDVSDEEAAELMSELEKIYVDIEFDINAGKQPIYNYYISVE